MNDDFDIDLRDVLERVWRAKNKILLMQATVLLLAVLVILFWPRTYASVAKIYLQRGRESLGLDPTVGATGKTIGLQQSNRDAEIKSSVDVIQSRGIIEPVVDKLTPDVVLGHVSIGEGKSTVVGDFIQSAVSKAVEFLRSVDPASDRERAIVAIEKGLVVDAGRKSEIITITYEADNPQLAQVVVQSIVDAYKTKHSELNRTTGSTEFFDEQSQRLAAELETAAQALRDAKDDIGLASISDQRRILEERLGNIRMMNMDVEKNLQAAMAKSKNLTRQLSERPQRMATSVVDKANSPEDLQGQSLFNLKIQLMDARAKFTGQHPKVRRLEEQVARAETELNKQRKDRVDRTENINPVHEKLTFAFTSNSTDMAGLIATRDKLQALEKEVLTEIRDLNEHAVTIDQLERVVNVAEKKFITYSENLEEARIDLALQANSISSVNVAQPATMQEKPVSPSKPVVALCGILFSMAIGLVMAFLSVKFDSRITTAYSARKKLGVPVLGALPQSRTHSRVLR